LLAFNERNSQSFVVSVNESYQSNRLIIIYNLIIIINGAN